MLQTMMVWFWGINLWVFVQANVSYAKIFDLDQNHLTHREIWKVYLKIEIYIFYKVRALHPDQVTPGLIKI